MTPLKFILATLALVAINIAIGWWVAVRTAQRRHATGAGAVSEAGMTSEQSLQYSCDAPLSVSGALLLATWRTRFVRTSS